MQVAWHKYWGKSNEAWRWRVAWVEGEISVGPPSGVDPVGQMQLRIQNKQTILDIVWGSIVRVVLYGGDIVRGDIELGDIVRGNIV